MCGQLSKDAGEVRINGADQTHAGQDTRYLLGVVFQDSVLDKSLTVRENLKSRAALYGITGKAFENRLQELEKLLGFADYTDRAVGKLSGGQRQRVALASIIVQDPDIIVIDEPTSQLDPKGTEDVFEIIKYLNRQKKTIVLVEHKMNLIAEYADHIVSVSYTHLTLPTICSV